MTKSIFNQRECSQANSKRLVFFGVAFEIFSLSTYPYPNRIYSTSFVINTLRNSWRVFCAKTTSVRRGKLIGFLEPISACWWLGTSNNMRAMNNCLHNRESRDERISQFLSRPVSIHQVHTVWWGTLPTKIFFKPYNLGWNDIYVI